VVAPGLPLLADTMVHLSVMNVGLASANVCRAITDNATQMSVLTIRGPTTAVTLAVDLAAATTTMAPRVPVVLVTMTITAAATTTVGVTAIMTVDTSAVVVVAAAVADTIAVTTIDATEQQAWRDVPRGSVSPGFKIGKTGFSFLRADLLFS
jgi:hypothetical protein